jgi:uncharacterized protein YjbI with pentapeptide repeats
MGEEERRLRVAKLQVEIALLRQQLSPGERRYERLKVVAGVSGIITAGIAFVGVILSGVQWFRSESQNRAARAEERLERLLTLSAEPNPAARLAAVVSLASFLRDPDQARVTQTLLALTNMLGVESSVSVRNAILATVAELDPSRVEDGVLDRTLTSLAQVSRSLMQEGNLWQTRREFPHILPSDGSVEARAISVANAIAILIRKGGKQSDLSRTYLAATDLSGSSLPGVSFDDSILAWTDFRGADLAAASFVNADLDRTVFIEANLRKAKFEHVLEESPTIPRHNYIEEQLARTDTARRGYSPRPRQFYIIYGPDFRCADLRDASFKGYPLLPLALDEVAPTVDVLQVWESSFRYSNLEGTKFHSLRMFGVVPANWSSSADPYPLEGLSGHRGEHDDHNIVTSVVSDTRALGDTGRFTHVIRYTAYRFKDTNWSSAELPRALRQLLETQKTASAAPRRKCDAGRAL